MTIASDTIHTHRPMSIYRLTTSTTTLRRNSRIDDDARVANNLDRNQVCSCSEGPTLQHVVVRTRAPPALDSSVERIRTRLGRGRPTERCTGWRRRRRCRWCTSVSDMRVSHALQDRPGRWWATQRGLRTCTCTHCVCASGADDGAGRQQSGCSWSARPNPSGVCASYPGPRRLASIMRLLINALH